MDRKKEIRERLEVLEEEVITLKREWNRLTGIGPLILPSPLPEEFTIWEFDRPWVLKNLKKISDIIDPENKEISGTKYEAEGKSYPPKTDSDKSDSRITLEVAGSEILIIRSSYSFHWDERKGGYYCNSWMCKDRHDFEDVPPDFSYLDDEVKESIV